MGERSGRKRGGEGGRERETIGNRIYGWPPRADIWGSPQSCPRVLGPGLPVIGPCMSAG